MKAKGTPIVLHRFYYTMTLPMDRQKSMYGYLPFKAASLVLINYLELEMDRFGSTKRAKSNVRSHHTIVKSTGLPASGANSPPLGLGVLRAVLLPAYTVHSYTNYLKTNRLDKCPAGTTVRIMLLFFGTK